MVNNPGCCHAVDDDWLLQSILFCGFVHISAVWVLAVALVDYLGGHSVLSAKLVFDPKAVRVRQTQGLIAFCQTRFAAPNVHYFSAFLLPPASQKTFHTCPYPTFEIFNLRTLLVRNVFGGAIEKPTRTAHVGLNGANSAARKFRSFAIRIRDVVEEPGGKLGNTFVVTGEETTAHDRAHIQVVDAA